MPDQMIGLVTGAGKRLGKALAEGLAAEGYAVALHYNSSVDGVKELHDRIQADGGRSVLLQKDLSQPETAGSLLSDASKALPKTVHDSANAAKDEPGNSLLEVGQNMLQGFIRGLGDSDLLGGIAAAGRS